LLRPTWFQSPPVIAHARSFFPDFAPVSAPDNALIDELRDSDAATHEYLAYLLLDFAVMDRELEDVPLAAALDWSERLGMADQFEKLAIKELGIGKRQFNKLKKEAPEMLAKAGMKA